MHTASQSIHGYGTLTNHHAERRQTRDMLACIQSTKKKKTTDPSDTDFEEVLQAVLGVSSESIPAWSLCRYRFIPQSSTGFVSSMLWTAALNTYVPAHFFGSIIIPMAKSVVHFGAEPFSK